MCIWFSIITFPKTKWEIMKNTIFFLSIKISNFCFGKVRKGNQIRLYCNKNMIKRFNWIRWFLYEKAFTLSVSVVTHPVQKPNVHMPFLLPKGHYFCHRGARQSTKNKLVYTYQNILIREIPNSSSKQLPILPPCLYEKRNFVWVLFKNLD